MEYSNTVEGTFIERKNRFIASVRLNGKTLEVHVKNTGRCRELLVPGARVILAKGENPNRKTAYDLITVFKPELGWVNIDSQVPNALVQEWLKAEDQSRPDELRNVRNIIPEYCFGASRMDFYLETKDRKILMEVKGCTLERNGIGYFPDAPTERGIRHLRELTEAVRNGMDAYLAFVIAMPGVTEVLPNMQTHPQFGEALDEAIKKGVRVLYLACSVTENTICITDWRQNG